MSNAKKWVKWIQYGTLAVFIGGLATGYSQGAGLGDMLGLIERGVMAVVLFAVGLVVVGLGWATLGGIGHPPGEDVTGRVEIALAGSRRGAVVAIIALLVLAALVGGWFFSVPPEDRRFGPVGEWEPGYIAMTAVFVGVWAVLMLGMVLRLVRHRPWFVLTARGFLYAPGDIGPGFVRWQDVAALRETEIVGSSRGGRAKTTRVLAVGLRDPDKYTRRHNPVLRVLVQLGAKLHGAQSGGAADLLIDPSHFGGRYAEILARMQALQAEANGGGGAGG